MRPVDCMNSIRTTISSTCSSVSASTPPPTSPEETPDAKIARLEARVAELERDHAKISTEREILQRAAKYFAGETRW